MTDVFLNADFLKIALPAGGAIVAWFVNEQTKARAEQRLRREERYNELLRCLKGFYVHNQDGKLKGQFIDQVNLCWLYAPDEVIRRANGFFTMIDCNRKPLATDEEKQSALADLVISIRKDMLSRRWVRKTSLGRSDWKSFNA